VPANCLLGDVGESLGAACLCSAHCNADASSREGIIANPADRALSTWRRQDVFGGCHVHPALLTPPTPGIHRFTNAGHRHSVELFARSQSSPCDE